MTITGAADLINKEVIDLRINSKPDFSSITEAATALSTTHIGNIPSISETLKSSMPDFGNTNLFDWRCCVCLVFTIFIMRLIRTAITKFTKKHVHIYRPFPIGL